MSDIQNENMSFCLKRNIKIYVIPNDSKYYKIIIEYASGKIVESKELYKQNPTSKDVKWYNKIFELYGILRLKIEANEQQNKQNNM